MCQTRPNVSDKEFIHELLKTLMDFPETQIPIPINSQGDHPSIEVYFSNNLFYLKNSNKFTIKTKSFNVAYDYIINSTNYYS